MIRFSDLIYPYMRNQARFYFFSPPSEYSTHRLLFYVYFHSSLFFFFSGWILLLRPGWNSPLSAGSDTGLETSQGTGKAYGVYNRRDLTFAAGAARHGISRRSIPSTFLLHCF